MQLHITAALLALASLASAQTCFNAQDIDSNDFSGLISSVNNNNITPHVDNPFALNHKSSQQFAQGTAEFCVQNKFIFENTHVSLSTIANAAQQIFNNCGGGSQGGVSTIQGDSGLDLTFQVFRTGTETC
jgi:hypothetical protein